MPGAHVGSYGRQYGAVGLGKAITAYNTNIAGVTVTPAGQALINQGALLGGGGFTTANLIALGATPPTLPTPVAGQLGLSPLKAFDLTFSWVHSFWHEHLTLEPKVGLYNIFNFGNYDPPGNTMKWIPQRRAWFDHEYDFR